MTSAQARSGARRRAATQQDLLDATVRLLEDGAPLAAVTVADIVREAGVVRTTFYGHFKDRTELVTTLADEQLQWMSAAGQTGQHAPTDPDLSYPTVHRAVEQLVLGWVERRIVLSAIIETAEHDAVVHELWRNGIHNIAATAAGLFAAHWDAHPGLRPSEPAMVAEALTWMIERSCHQIAHEPTQVAPVVDALAEVIWRVLHAPSRTGT